MRMLLFAILLASVGACHRTMPSGARQPLFFLQLADPQFGFFTANADFARETINFERAIAAANRLHPAFVIVCGDLTHRAGDAAQIAEYRRIVAGLDRSIPLYSVPGNHDLASPPTTASVQAFRAQYGPDRYTFTHGGLLGIVINSTLIKEPTGSPEETAAQEQWIRTTLDAARRRPHAWTLLFQHHSWFLAQADEPDQYFNLPLARRREFLDLFKAAGVSHVFAGHYHRNAMGRDGTLEMVTTGPVGKPLGADSSGLRIVVLSDAGVEHRYYPLDSLPDRIQLPVAR